MRASACLAIDARTEVAHAETDIEERGKKRIPRSRLKTRTVTRRGTSCWCSEDKEKGAEQKLVGHGIEVLGELGLLLEQSRGQPIEAITESGNDDKGPQEPR